MTIKIKSVTAKNFLSIGNITQAVDFSKDNLTLVLGENIDLGGEDSGNRNGTGKSTILNALSYALYGSALTNIKKDNLINNINSKNMLTTVEFEKNNTKYKIERGRKPNILKLYINDSEIKNVDENESQGDSRETQKTIDLTLEMSHTMFKHLVALNTYTEPFLSMGAGDQRNVIEQLLGITQLSEKADNLKLLIKDTKDKITVEEAKITAIKTANANVQKSIDSLELKNTVWNNKHIADIENLNNAITNLENVNIDNEIQLHNDLKLWNELDKKFRSLRKEKATLESALNQALKSKTKYVNELEILKNNTCPTCKQDLHDHNHEELYNTLQSHLLETENYLNKLNIELQKIISELGSGKLPNQPSTFYDSESEAHDHKNNLINLKQTLSEKLIENNPYKEQIIELKNTAIQDINWDKINELSRYKDHQEFLHKLLTNKDSFIRKKIIDQNLAYLNKRLTYYIDKLGLPHKVIFKNDLTVEITQLGQDLDFDNLSRGERNRLILSISFAFRDVWEGLYQPINLLFIDELIDSGMDNAGVESSLSILKMMARERDKNIFLISHKDELISRVDNILKVIKSNGFTNYTT